MDAPAEETERTGLGAAAGGAEGEQYWFVWWLDGVRGGPLLPGSGVDVISHFGGMTDCLGGRGSRKVSRKASTSGTKWLSDSARNTISGLIKSSKTVLHDDETLLKKGVHLYSIRDISLLLFYTAINVCMDRAGSHSLR